MNPQELRHIYFDSKKIHMSRTSKVNKKLERVKSVNLLREREWNNRFIYNKIPNYDSSRDKNVLIIHKLKGCYGYKRFSNISPVKTSKLYNNSYLSDFDFNKHRPLSNKATKLILGNQNFKYFSKNQKIKTISAKAREIHFSNLNNEPLDYGKILYGYNNNNPDMNYNYINLNNIIKLWDELCVKKPYRKLFCVIYREVDNEDKEDLYQREINELKNTKEDILALKNYITIRINTIQEISEINNRLNKEVVKKDKKANEKILNEMSEKIGELREKTIDVVLSMRNFKIRINGVSNLEKYDIDSLGEKFRFDPNYLIKMKTELNFLRDGFAKYFFNFSDDKTPFLTKASDNNKISKEDPFIHLIPLKKDRKNEIMECIYYIYQELIAYQNKNANKNFLRSISPLKKSEQKLKKNNNGRGVIDRQSPPVRGSFSDGGKFPDIDEKMINYGGNEQINYNNNKNENDSFFITKNNAKGNNPINLQKKEEGEFNEFLKNYKINNASEINKINIQSKEKKVKKNNIPNILILKTKNNSFLPPEKAEKNNNEMKKMIIKDNSKISIERDKNEEEINKFNSSCENNPL